MPTKDNELTEKEKTWIKKLQAVLRAKPKGIEMIVGYGDIRIYPKGSMSKHLGSKYDSFDIDSNPELQDLELKLINADIIAYTEGV